MNTDGERRTAPAVSGPPVLPRNTSRDAALMYVWEADDGQGRKRSGVTGFRHRAVLDLFQAMCGMPSPGATGTLRAAVLDAFARRPAYLYTPVLMRLWRDDVTGGIRIEGNGL